MFQLAKTWVDYVPTNHTVEIRYTWSELHQRPRWNGDEEAEVMSVLPNTNPPTRLAVLEIPRYLAEKPNYLLHYRFGGGGEFREGFSHDFTEEIVSHEVEYVDSEGRLTEVRVLWSVDGWSAPNWSQARLKDLNSTWASTKPATMPRVKELPTKPFTSWCRPCRCRATSSGGYGDLKARRSSTSFNFCAPIRRCRRMSSHGGTITRRRTTA